MKFRDLWLKMDRPEREQMAASVGSTYKYLQKLSGGFGVPSMAFAGKLIERYPRLTYQGFVNPRAPSKGRARKAS